MELSDVSSDADTDEELGPGPCKSHNLSISANDTLLEDSDEDESLSEVSFNIKPLYCVNYTPSTKGDCAEEGCQETWESDIKTDLETEPAQSPRSTLYMLCQV